MKTGLVILSKIALLHTVREEHLQLSEKAVKLFFSNDVCVCEVGFSLYPSIKTTYNSRLKAEADVLITLASTKSDIKCKTMLLFLPNVFCLGKHNYLSKHVIYDNI